MAVEMPEFKRSPHISMRLAPEEKALFLRALEADGKKSLSTWLKHLARQRVAELQEEGALSTEEKAPEDRGCKSSPETTTSNEEKLHAAV